MNIQRDHKYQYAERITIHNNLSHWKITKDYRENIIFCKRSQSDELTSVDICMSNKKTASFVFFSIIIFQFKQRIKNIYMRHQNTKTRIHV